MNRSAKRPLVAIMGPTASGKSALGVWLALQLGGEVVACDSTQLYWGFDIGTAKVSAEDRRGVPHHLVDVLHAHEGATAGGYRERALEVLRQLRERERLPIFTVGTGLYLRALLEGLADVPQRCESLRERLRNSAVQHESGHLHKMLRRLDPVSAGKIAAADAQKLIRAVEVCLLAKRPMSEVHREGREPLQGWRVIKIGLEPEREAIYERIHARTEAMLACGWQEEVRRLVERGLPEDAKPFNFIGYRELRAVLRGKMKLDEARATIEQATRRYAKRQLTWFRREVGVKWLKGFGDEAEIQWAALELVRPELGGSGSTRGREMDV
jgi:tRNA dimethylallyltransferase